MSHWKSAFLRLLACDVYFVIFVLSLYLTACGGGSGSSGTSGGGGGGNGGGGNVSPASGEYLWETSTSDNKLFYATINATTGELGAPTVAASPVSIHDDYPRIVISPSRNFLFALSDQELVRFQISGPGLQLGSAATFSFTGDSALEDSMTLSPNGQFLYVIGSGGYRLFMNLLLIPPPVALCPARR
jgi:hypothetical protein